MVDARVKSDTDLIDVAVGPTAYSLDEFVLVLGIPTAYVTGQRIRVHRSHRERLEGRDERKREEGRGERDTRGRVPWIRPQRPRIDARIRAAAFGQRSGNI